jgi:arabinose-5-phosphate isomerase
VAKAFMRVEQLMHVDGDVPRVREDTPMPDVLYEISNKKLGMTTVVRDAVLIGIITDGDLRRAMSVTRNLLERTAADVMMKHPVTIARSTLAGDARQILEQRKITSMVVVDAEHRVEGVLHLHDLWDT